MPTVTTDLVIFRSPTEKAAKNYPTLQNTEILLIKRKNEPFINQWALVGEHFETQKDESLLACAVRGAQEEVSLNIDPDTLIFLNHYDKPNRDPRGRYISVVYAADVKPDAQAVAADDAAECKWFSAKTLFQEEIPLAFDHQEIINEFCSMVFGEENED